MALKQFKVKELAENFNMKSKQISDILVSYGIPGKNTTATLGNAELNIIFEHMTKNGTVEDIDAYMYSPKEKKAEKKPELPPAPPVTPAAKPPVKSGAAPQGTAKQPVKPAETAKERPGEAKNPGMKKQQQQQQQSSGQRPQNHQAQQHNNNQRQGQNQGGQNQSRGQNQAQSQAQAGRQSHRKERDYSNPAFNRDGRQNRRDENRGGGFRQNQQRPDLNSLRGKNQPGVNDKVGIISGDSIKLAAGVKNESAKIVDMRTSTVDLSKYDEKHETFVSEADRKRNFPNDRDKQKSKKSPPYSGGRDRSYSYDRHGRPIDKEKLALENLRKKQREQELEKAKRKPLSVILPERIIGSDLAAKLRVTSAEVIKKLFLLGVKATINEEIEYDTAALVAMEFGAKVEKEVVVTIEDRLFDESGDPEDKLVSRAPVVVVMGHVDHGKTSLLDSIKDTNVTAGEAGGITQHIGAYRVEVNNREITFLDTPGHAAFTAMRARGAKSTDIAILVVAADDGIMPQTIEAINHAKAANVSIIVAINKMDKPQANPEQVKQALTQHELVPEEWGGDIICVPVSAVTRQGIDELLEMILLVADMKDLKSNPDRLAQGVVIEAKLDKGRGPVATVLVQKGTLKTGDIVIAGTAVGRVRAMHNDRGSAINSAGPSVPAEIIGLSETPDAGDAFRVVGDEKMARELVEQRKSEEKEELFKTSSNITLDDLFMQVKSGVKELNIIIKADVQGSVEALKASLIKESTEEVKIKPIHSAVGGITESDIMLASASNAIVIGFNVRPDKTAIDAAERIGVDVRTYRVIYECIEEMSAAMKGMLAPKFKEVLLGHAQVRQTIKVPNIGTIAGSYVQDGKIARNSQIRVVRDGIVIFEDRISSLRRFKDDVREVAQGFECGIGLEKFND
ncbi:MAG: translation initiation factor IF-2, partial [Oscillospiraceae bacterium]|nr:translation initiation factor IF-2 [Oscillospiraceae bacterium]